MVNTGGRPGGAITAALFLKQVYDRNITYFFCLIWVVQWLVLIVIHAFQGLFLLYLNFCLSLIFVVFLFFNFYKPWRKGREGEVRGGVLGDWGSRVSCCSYFDLLLSKVLFNCSCYGFLKLLSCDFAVCWWEGSMDAYWLSRPSLEWEETCCNRIWHFYFGRVGFEELFLDKDWSILLGSHTHQGRRGGTMSQSILDGVSNHMNKYVGGVK